MINCSRPADLPVHLFSRAVKREIPHPKCENFFLILYICTRPQVDSLMSWIFLYYFFMNFKIIFNASKYMNSCSKSLNNVKSIAFRAFC